MTLPVDLPELFTARLRELQRPPDGLLHASSDLTGSLRHSQLKAAGAPMRPRSLTDEVVLMTGTLWHTWAHQALVAAGLAFMQEVRLERWLPEGWSGTADWIFFDPERMAFVLGDMKTIKGDGLAWIARDGAKTEHLWQLSAYWHALYDMGLPLVRGFGVLYWPKDRPGTGEAEPIVMDCEPLDRELVHGVMHDRWEATKTYLRACDTALIGDRLNGVLDYSATRWLNDELAPEQERIQKAVWNKKAQVFDLKLVPHWSAQYCPFEPPLCSCSEQGQTKIGEYDLAGDYTPRKGHEDAEPAVAPTDVELKRRRKEAA